MEAIAEIDDLANFMRAIRFGFDEVESPTDVTDKMLVEMAKNGDYESGLFILQEYNRSLDRLGGEQSCPALFAYLVESLAYGHVPRQGLKNWLPIKFVPLGKLIVKSHSDLLGKYFAPYLQECFDVASKDYEEYAVPPRSECYIEEETPFWLTQAFYVAPTKKSGKKRDLERDAEVLYGIHRIWLALAAPRKGRKSQLENHLRSYSIGEFPTCISRLIKLRGHRQSISVFAKQLDTTVESLLAELALDLVGCVERAEATVSGPARVRRMAAANMFATCQDFNIKQADALICRSSPSWRSMYAYGAHNIRK